MPVPYLIATPAAEAISFYTRVLGARELVRLTSPDAKIAHAELAIGDDKLMLADAYPEMGYASPTDLGGSPVSLYVRVADAVVVCALPPGGVYELPLQIEMFAVDDVFGITVRFVVIALSHPAAFGICVI